MNAALVKAFFHRGRKQPVPWTAEEIAARINMPIDDAINELCAHAQLGLTKAERKNRKNGSAIWALTKVGEKTVAHMIKAEGLIRK